MSIRVMLASGSHEVMGRLSTVVTEVADLSLAGRASTSNAVPTLLRRGDVDVLVIDEELGPMLALDLVRDVVGRFPYVAVVVAGRGEDVSTLRSAVDSGARGLVSIGMSFEEIAARLRVASSWAASVRALVAAERAGRTDIDTGSLVALNGAKGGVGVTTVATRLALDAAHAGRSVCLVDMDLQSGDVGFLLDIEHHRAITDLIGVNDESGIALEDSLYAHTSGLRVLLPPGDGERGEDIDQEVSRQVLSRLRSIFDLVIVDCGAVLTEASAVALSMAEHAVIVTTPDVIALRASRRMSELWARLEVRGPKDCTVLLNKVSKGSEVQPTTAQRITGLPHLAATVPAAFRKLEEGVNTTTPAKIEDRALRRAYAALSQELSVVVPVPKQKPPREGRRRGGRASSDAEKQRDGGAVAAGSRGSVAVETAAFVPLALAVIGLLLQVALIGYTYVLVGESANRASRAVAVGEGAGVAEEAALAILPDGWRAQDVSVTVVGGGGGRDEEGRATGHAEVTVDLPVPLLGLGLPFPWTASATSAWGEE